MFKQWKDREKENLDIESDSIHLRREKNVMTYRWVSGPNRAQFFFLKYISTAISSFSILAICSTLRGKITQMDFLQLVL